MRKREFVFAALTATVLASATSRAASAQAGCGHCVEMYGDTFYVSGDWIDDAGGITAPDV
jgi:hypothetical protein